MNDEIRIINDEVEIKKFLAPNVAPAYRIRYFLSYHPQAFRLIIINPSDKIKTDYEKITEAIIKIPGFKDYDYHDRDIDIRLLDANKRMIGWYNMDIDDNTLDFRSDINAEEITETIVYFYYYDEKNTFYKFNSYKSTVVDKRIPEKFIHPVPERIERISYHQYVPCITHDYREVPKEKIPHDKIFLKETYFVERMNLEYMDELIILPQEATIDPSNELQLDVEKYKENYYLYNNLKNFLTLQDYEQHIEESKQKFRGITLTSKTNKGFNLHDIIYRFDLTEQIDTPYYVMIMGGGYLALCNAAFRDSLLEKGFEQEKILEYSRSYLSKGSYSYYFNNNDTNSYDEMVVQYFGVDKVLKYGHIINNFLFIEVDEIMYFFQAPDWK